MAIPKENSSCKQATVLMSKSMEQELSLKENAALAAHLAICKTCCFCYNQLKTIRETIKNYADVIFSHPVKDEHKLSEEAKQRIKQSLG